MEQPRQLNTSDPDAIMYQTEELGFTVLGGIRLDGLDRLRVTLKIEVTNRKFVHYLNSPELAALAIRHNIDLYNDTPVEKLIRCTAERLETGISALTEAVGAEHNITDHALSFQNLLSISMFQHAIDWSKQTSAIQSQYAEYQREHLEGHAGIEERNNKIVYGMLSFVATDGAGEFIGPAVAGWFGAGAKVGGRAIFAGVGTEAAAIGQGYETLGPTRAAQNLQNLIISKNIPWSEAEPMWERLSSVWANGIPDGASVPAFLNTPRVDAILFRIEVPILETKNVNIVYKLFENGYK